MKHDRVSLSFTVGVFVLWFLLGAPTVATSLWQAPATPTVAPKRITATIRSVDAKTRTLYLLTGVGHALRGVYMQVHPACEIKVAGAAADLRALRPGQIVRIHYQKTADRNLAQSIETVPVEGTQSKQ